MATVEQTETYLVSTVRESVITAGEGGSCAVTGFRGGWVCKYLVDVYIKFGERSVSRKSGVFSRSRQGKRRCTTLHNRTKIPQLSLTDTMLHQLCGLSPVRL